jgi:hypothetical protein
MSCSACWPLLQHRFAGLCTMLQGTVSTCGGGTAVSHPGTPPARQAMTHKCLPLRTKT